MAGQRRLERFEDEWPALAQRLSALLSGKKLSNWQRDDIVQETGLRLFRMWDQVDPDRPLWPLTVTIALNLLRDEARRRARSEVLGALPDRPANEDVERAGIARLELQRVRKAFEHLRAAHRDVLMVELGGAPVTGRGPNAIKMLRLRARRELHALLDRASAGIAVALGAARRLAASLQSFLTSKGLGNAEAAAPAAAASLLAALVLVAGLPGARSSGGTAGRGRVERVARAPGGGAALAGATRASFADTTGSSLPGSPAQERTGKAARPDDGRLSVPLPVGGERVEGHVWAEVAGYGVDVGDHGALPVCVMTKSASLRIDLSCEREASKQPRAGAQVGTSSHSAGVSVGDGS